MSRIRLMSLELTEAVSHEHNAALEAVHRAQARALHLGEMLLQVRQELGPVVWDHWLENGCPIPARAARRTSNHLSTPPPPPVFCSPSLLGSGGRRCLLTRRFHIAFVPFGDPLH